MKKIITLNEHLFRNEKKWANDIYLRQPINGQWHDFTWAEVVLQARKVAHFLQNSGLKKGDKIAIYSKNCAEWFIADFAISLAGMVSVPLFANLSESKIEYILEHAEVKAIFVGKLDQWDKANKVISSKITRIAFPYENAMPAQYQWNQVIADTEPLKENYLPDPEDIYTIVYTSGTTGMPKGAMLSYRAFASVIEPFVEDDKNGAGIYPSGARAMSYLPLAHIFERVVIENISVAIKSTVSFVESIDTFLRNLQETAPTLFQSVPRLWVQFQQGVLHKIPQEKLDKLLKIPLVSRLLKFMIRRSLGLHKSLFNASGSAPLSPSVIQWYKTIGIDIYEGYGSTENSAVVCFEAVGDHKDGYVGRPRRGVEVRLGENNELLVRTDALMTGYYKDEEATKKAFTSDGFYKTGDKVEIDEEGRIKILGRVSEEFKTDKGEFINPIPIEKAFAKNHLVEQHCLIGARLPFTVMLVNLSAAAKKMDKKLVEKNLEHTLFEVNKHLTKFEAIKHVYITQEDWTTENEMLTPTLKLRRTQIAEKYTDLIRPLIESKEAILWE